MKPRRIALQLLLIRAELLFSDFRARDPIVSLVDQHWQVADARNVDGATEEFGIPFGAQQRQITAKAPADDANSLRVRDALLNCPARTVNHVIVGQAAPVLVCRKKPVA